MDRVCEGVKGGWAGASERRGCENCARGAGRVCYASHMAESPMELILEVRYAWH